MAAVRVLRSGGSQSFGDASPRASGSRDGGVARLSGGPGQRLESRLAAVATPAQAGSPSASPSVTSMVKHAQQLRSVSPTVPGAASGKSLRCKAAYGCGNMCKKDAPTLCIGEGQPSISGEKP